MGCRLPRCCMVPCWARTFLKLGSPSSFLGSRFFAVLGVTLGMSFLMALDLEGPIENLRPQLVNKLTHLRRVP